jgi:hypothetical protein
MTRLPLLLPLLALGGCIIYDHAGKCPRCDRWDDTGDWWADDTAGGGDTDGDDTDGDDTDVGDTGDAAADPAFTLSPSEGEVGTTFIASLTAGDGFDLSTVQGLEFFGGVDVLASETRPTEILLSLSIPDTTAPGTADLLVRLPDDQVAFLPDALTIVAAGTGDGTGGDGTDGGTDSGSDGSDGGSDSGGSASCP